MGSEMCIRDSYYAAFVFDPDGTNVEVVDHHRS